MKQETVDKISNLLNKNKDFFGKDIEYIHFESIKTNVYNIKRKIEIWKKLEDKPGLIYVNYFHVYKNETYEEAINNFLEVFNND